jgi:hypothetical protein
VHTAPIIRIRVIALMMEAASTSETSINCYQTTRHNNPEAIFDLFYSTGRIATVPSQTEISFFGKSIQLPFFGA